MEELPLAELKLVLSIGKRKQLLAHLTLLTTMNPLKTNQKRLSNHASPCGQRAVASTTRAKQTTKNLNKATLLPRTNKKKTSSPTPSMKLRRKTNPSVAVNNSNSTESKALLLLLLLMTLLPR